MQVHGSFKAQSQISSFIIGFHRKIGQELRIFSRYNLYVESKMEIKALEILPRFGVTCLHIALVAAWI